MNFEGIKVVLDKSLPKDVDIQYYVKKLRAQHRNQEIKRISFVFQDKALLIRYTLKNNPFECILRISTDDSANRPAV